ncbi:TonB-dependent receptor [Methylobacillus flagellatus]|uniref:TonB-dependent receptor n=1 Tax=Methylobacillus flagellatus TaxID=405 RepID=UPI000306CB98|nr:TonB-dependent siderophore receptor [Methylobacillus flagellatus]
MQLNINFTCNDNFYYLYSTNSIFVNGCKGISVQISSKKKTIHFQRVTTAVALAFAGASHAAEEGGALPEVSVSAKKEASYKVDRVSSPKFTEPLLDTPKSITVVNEELIQARGLMSLTDILRTTPGVTLGSGEGGTPMGDRPFIRGYEASTDLQIDGIRQVGRFSHEIFNLESVEIIKGPGSMQNGRGSTGGVINMVTKKPKAENFTSAGVTWGTDQTKRFTVDTNWLLGDEAALRINLVHHDANVAGREAVELERKGIAAALALGLNTSTRANVSFYHFESDDTPDLGLPFSAGGALRTPPRVDRDNFYGLKNRDFREQNADQITLRLEHDFDHGFTLRNTTMYTRTTNQYIMTRPSFANAAAFANGIVDQSIRGSRRLTEGMLNQTDYFGSVELFGMKHNISTGIEISKEELSSGGYQTATGGNTNAAGTTTDLYNPNPYAPFPGGPFRRTDYGDPFKYNTRAWYASDTIHFNEQWQANVGIRLDHYRVVDTSDPTVHRKDRMFNYTLGLLYKPAPNGSVYFNLGTSSNPTGETAGQSGGADGVAGGRLTAANMNVAPERTRAVELGTKWDVFNNRLSLTAAIFETKKTDARAADPTTGEVALVGDNSVKGIDLGAAGNITDKWSVWGGVVFMDPVLDKFAANTTSDYSGNQSKFIAKRSGSLWTMYKVTPKFSVGGGAIYAGKRYLDDANTMFFDSTWRWDASATYEVNQKLSLRLNVLNLTDERIYDASHVGIFAVMAPGRSALLNATYHF